MTLYPSTTTPPQTTAIYRDFKKSTAISKGYNVGLRYIKNIIDEVTIAFANFTSLKVPKCEILDRSDFHYFYTIKPFWVDDFVVKILTYYFNFWGSQASFIF